MAKSRSSSTPKKVTRAAVAPAPAPPAAPKKASARATAKGNGQVPETPQVVMMLSHDQIARRAYEIWLAKGRPPGQDEQNWRQAERELRTGGLAAAR